MSSRHIAGHFVRHGRTGIWLRVRVSSGVESGTTLRCPEVVRETVTPKTIGVANSSVGTVSIVPTRLAALALLQFGACVLGAALLRGPVVNRVVTLTPLTRSRTEAAVITVITCTRNTHTSDGRWCE